jgi:uncharacterized protein (DUF2164 family)
MVPLKLPKDQKDEIIKKVQAFFEEERSETIGILAADQLVDFMLKELGPYVYNKAIADVRVLTAEKAAQFEEELYAMEMPVNRRR